MSLKRLISKKSYKKKSVRKSNKKSKKSIRKSTKKSKKYVRKSTKKSKKSSRKLTKKSKKSSRKSTKKSKKSSRKSTKKSKKSVRKSVRKSKRKSKKSSRKSSKKSNKKSRKSKKIDNGDFSDTGRYNINERVIKEYPRNVLIQKYTELIEFLGLRKRQLQLYNRSTFRIDMQLKAAMAERLYLVKNPKWSQKILIGLNKMP